MTTDATAESEVLLPGQVSNESLDDAIAESSSDSEEKHEPKIEEKDAVQKRFDKLTFEKYEAKREIEKLKAELTAKPQVTQEPMQQETQLVAPHIPDDIYDEEAMRKYHAETATYNQKATQKQVEEAYKSRENESLQKAQSEQQRAELNTYVNNAIKDGVNIEKLTNVENTLNQAGITPELGRYIINDPNGAKVAEYLVDNPAEMYEVLSLDPVSAGIKIASEIKQKALSKTPNVSNAPEPIPNISGGGYIEKDEFDKKYPGAQFI